ncbi:MAG: histidine kinase [Deltaproteobacteria bacterium]|nr:histidine kinase [Deltaproteobacteria bacterium]
MERLIEELQTCQRRLERRNEALRASQKALREAHDKLEARVLYRTMELESANKRLEAVVKEKTRIADSLVVSETRYRTLVESTDDFIYLVNGRGEYLFINSRTRSFYNLRPNEVSGVDYGDLHGEKETAVFMERVHQVFKESVSIRQEHHQKGRYYLRTLSPVKARDGGAVRSVTVVSKDITDETRLQAELVRSNEKLRQEQAQRIRLSKRLIDLLEEYRRRIAGDLHDQVGQSLTSLKLSLEHGLSGISGGNRALHERMAEAIRNTSDVLHDIKNISRELRPPILDSFGLSQSLAQLLKELEQKGMKTHFFQKGLPGRFHPEKELAFY